VSVDSAARKVLGSALRRYAAGIASNNQLEGSIPTSDDPAIWSIVDYAWTLYGDGCEYVDSNGGLTKTDKATIARCILFLKSELEYEYPKSSDADYSLAMFLRLPLNILTFGAFGRWLKAKELDFHNHGDASVWPFISRKQLNSTAQQLARPTNAAA
jgi:hypothetical protein